MGLLQTECSKQNKRDNLVVPANEVQAAGGRAGVEQPDPCVGQRHCERTTAPLQCKALWQHAGAVRDVTHLHLWSLRTGQAGRKSRGFRSFRSLRDPALSPLGVIEG